MKKIWELWPLIVALLISWPLNVSWMVIPALRGRGILMDWQLWLVAEILSNLELPYWWWFWGWLGRNIKELRPVKEAVELAKEKIEEAQKDRYVRSRYLDPLKEHFVNQYDWFTNPGNIIIRWLKRSGHGAMFVLGVEMLIPGLRVAGSFFCRTTGWKAGFATLLIGNFFHVTIMVWGWSWFFSRFWPWLVSWFH